MKHSSKAFTLIETLISLAIAATVLSVLLQLFILLSKNERKNNQKVHQLIRFQNFFLTGEQNSDYPQDKDFYKIINTIHTYGTFTKYALSEKSADIFAINVFTPRRVTQEK
jgi:prepilin-type N-terminal cleavage/methylation domain-containing protein